MCLLLHKLLHPVPDIATLGDSVKNAGEAPEVMDQYHALQYMASWFYMHPPPPHPAVGGRKEPKLFYDLILMWIEF